MSLIFNTPRKIKPIYIKILSVVFASIFSWP